MLIPSITVAMTRPKRSLTVIGDSETVKRCVLLAESYWLMTQRGADFTFLLFRGSKFLKKWMEFLEENADLRYPDIAEVNRE